MDERTEIEEAVGELLGKMGIGGSIAINGKAIELVSGGAPIAVDIDLIIRQWPLLPAEMKGRKAQEIARRLADAKRSLEDASGGPRARSSEGAATRRLWALAGGAVALLALVGLGRMALSRIGAEKVEAKVPTEAAEARNDRLARACDAMRDRLYKGASFGPFATEGWVVEIWLASRKGPLAGHPALTGLVAGGKLASTADAELAKTTDGTVEIVDGFSEAMAARSPGWSGAVVAFRDGYARGFFEIEPRQRYVALADRLADATGAEAGALYARCAHLKTHDIGAWYRGPDAAGAVASMLYQVGFFSDPSVIVLDRTALAAKSAGTSELEAMRKAAGAVDADALQKDVTSQGATVSTTSGVSFVFPLAGPTRALAASQAAAKRMGIGQGGAPR